MNLLLKYCPQVFEYGQIYSGVMGGGNMGSVHDDGKLSLIHKV